MGQVELAVWEEALTQARVIYREPAVMERVLTHFSASSLVGVAVPPPAPMERELIVRIMMVQLGQPEVVPGEMAVFRFLIG